MTACTAGSANLPIAGSKVLEVIVTSLAEALEAEQGGADRLEIVRCLEQGGLTPSFDTVQQITSIVRIPVRVMLRDVDSVCVSDGLELGRLTVTATEFAALNIEGLVLGFLRDGLIDEIALFQILSAVPGLAATFHRAFEKVQSPLDALATLKRFPQIDRVLIRIAEDGSGISLPLALAWQELAAPQIRFIAGIGLNRSLLHSISKETRLTDIHVGRGAREPETLMGAVSRVKIAQLKSALQ